MNEYPNLDKLGGNVLKTKAAQWKALFDDARRGAGIQIEGFDRSDLPGGLRFTRPRGPLPEPTLYADKFVAITQPVTAESKYLVVREVRYKHSLPHPCVDVDDALQCHYEWFNAAFQAYPKFGTKLLDFEEDDVDEASEPDAETPIFRCFKNHDKWIVEKPPEGGGGGIRPAYISVAPAAGATTVRVQPVKRSGLSWIPDGAAATIPIWGYQRGEDFASLYDGGTSIIPLINVGGEWYAIQYLWMFVNISTAPLVRGTCIP